MEALTALAGIDGGIDSPATVSGFCLLTTMEKARLLIIAFDNSLMKAKPLSRRPRICVICLSMLVNILLYKVVILKATLEMMH